MGNIMGAYIPQRTFDAFDDNLDYAIVGPHDDRVQTYDTRRFPYNTVCHLLRDFGNGRWLGASGVLIAPNVLLTAAHCLYKHQLGRGPRRMLVVPGRSDRDTMPFGSSEAAAFFVPRDYVRARGLKRRRFDYGVVILRAPVTADLRQFLPLQTVSNDQWRAWRSQATIKVCGYPSDKPIGTQWHHQEAVHKATPSRLFYPADTCPGHSGSPIWLNQGDQPSLVGIHTTGMLDEKGRSYGCKKDTVLAPPGMLNSGVRFTPSVLATIRQARRGRSPAMIRFDIG
jgi:V8-like Glu-specific endopeptidase